MNDEDKGFSRRSLCTRSAALPVVFSGIGSLNLRRPEPTVQWHHSAAESGGLLPSATDGERVYAFTEDAVVALTTDDGSEQWLYERSHSGIPPQAVGKENVYAVSREGDGFSALDPTTGEEQWRSPVPGIPHEIGGTTFAVDDKLYAYNVVDGTTEWTFEVSEGVTGMAPTADTVIIGGAGRLYAVRREDGRERWRFEIPDARKQRYLYPAQADVNNSRLLVWDYRKHTLQLFDATDGHEQWRYTFDTQTTLFRGIVTERSVLVVEGSDLVAVALSDGAERWRFTADEMLSSQLQSFEKENSVLARSGNRMYSISLDGGTVDWTFDADGEIEQVRADEDVVLATDVPESTRRQIVRVSGRDGSLKWVAETRTERLNALVSNGHVYVGTDTGLELLETPSGVVESTERFVRNEPVRLSAGGLSVVAVIGSAYHFLSD